MIREDLLEFQYYLDRLSKFMQESHGVSGQAQTFWSLLKQVNDYYDEFFDNLDVFNVNGSESHEDPIGKMLDDIGAIFGCRREFTIPIYNLSNPLQIDSYAQISLNDEDFLIYIKTQIIKQSFDGTRENLQKLYSTYVNGKEQKGLIDLRFLYTTEDDEPGAICSIRWDKENPSEGLKLLFENGYLTIESVGILYRRSISNFNYLAYYAKDSYSLVKTPSAPADWATAQGKYFSISESGPAASEWDDSAVYAKKTGDGYAILHNQPTNWSESYSQFVIIELTPKTTEAYSANSFYARSSLNQSRYANTSYELLSSEPSDWARGGYYKISAESPTSSWDSDKIYAKQTLAGYELIPHQPTYWAGLESFSGYAIMDKTDGTETFAADTYYKAESAGGLYA